MENKRRYPRFDMAAKISYKKLVEVNNLQDGYVKNVSAEGFCFSSKQRLKPGEIGRASCRERV